MRYRCAIPARLNGFSPISAHQLYSTPPRPVKQRALYRDPVGPSAFQPEADIQRHLEDDVLAFDPPALLEHLEPLDIAQRLLRP